MSSNINGQDALVVADTLDTLSAVLKRAVARAIVEKADPLSPTPFTGSASGAIEAALSNMSQLSFSQADVDAVKAAIDRATEYENRVEQATGRAIQVMNTIKPLLTKLIPLII